MPKRSKPKGAVDSIDEGIAENLKLGVRTVVVKYRDMTLAIPHPDLEIAVALLGGRAAPRGLLNAVTAAIDADIAKMESSPRRPSQKQMDHFISNIMLWFANEVVEGRASLDIH